MRASVCMGLLLMLAGAPIVPAHAQSMPSPLDFGVAIERGDTWMAKRWLDAGLSPDFQGDRYGTGLMIAASEGNIPMMELFLSRGARVDAVNKYGEQALQLAAFKGHMAAVKLLLERGAPVSRDGKGWSALHYSAFNGHREIVQLLLQRGANVNARAPNDATPLMLAAREGQDQIADQLIKAGADPRLTNDLGETAAVWAHRHGHLSIAQLVSTPEAFANLAKEPPPQAPQRSVAAPSKIDDLLRRIRYAQQQNLPTAGLQKALMNEVERARYEAKRAQKEAEQREANTLKGVVVTAKRPVSQGAEPASGGERVELVFDRKPRSDAPPVAPAGAPSPNAGTAATAPSSAPVRTTEDSKIALQLARIRAAQQRGEPTDALRKELFDMISGYRKSE